MEKLAANNDLTAKKLQVIKTWKSGMSQSFILSLKAREKDYLKVVIHQIRPLIGLL